MSEDTSELFKEIRLAVSERLASPLVGTYSISWVIWNFKFFLIAFSGEQVNSKLILIHDQMFWGVYGYLWTFCGPAVMTALYIFAYPYPAQFVYEFRLKFQRQLNQIRQKEEDEELLSVEDSRKLRLEVREKEREFTGRLDDAEKEISDLRRENASLKARGGKPATAEASKEISGHVSQTAPDTKKKLKKVDPFRRVGGLNTEEVAVIKFLSDVLPDSLNERSIIPNVVQKLSETGRRASRPKVRQALSSLLNRKLVASDGSTIDPNYRLSKTGEEFCLAHDL